MTRKLIRPNDKLRAFWKSANLAKDKFRRGNILLTGAAGYLGSFLLQRLVEDTEARTKHTKTPIESSAKKTKKYETHNTYVNS